MRAAGIPHADGLGPGGAPVEQLRAPDVAGEHDRESGRQHGVVRGQRLSSAPPAVPGRASGLHDLLADSAVLDLAAATSRLRRTLLRSRHSPASTFLRHGTPRCRQVQTMKHIAS